MEKSIYFCSKVAEVSSEFEKNNTDLKKRYLISHIMLYNSIVAMIKGNCGSFGTGYPFYALGKYLSGTLPVIEEQIRYNNELVTSVVQSEQTMWNCYSCLTQNGSCMPDLKQICKPCPNMDNELKPRKVLNRLPDIDMWMICEDDYVDVAKEQIITLFKTYNLTSSDINPAQTISDVFEITEKIKQGIMPEKFLPLDTHIIDYSTIKSLIEQIPFTLKEASSKAQVPYLPIHPLSYRKTWQQDDMAYNFVHDYLSSFTDYDFNIELKQLLLETRRIVANSYSFEQLYNYLLSTGPESVKRRHKTLELRDRFKERIDSWKN